MNHWLTKFFRLNQLYGKIEDERIIRAKPDNVLAGYIRRDEFQELVQKHAELFEQILQQLDPVAWDVLIRNVLPYSCSKVKSRVWQEFWNHMDEARGYVLLKERGYTDVEFIPREKTKKGKNEQFADLEGKTLVSRAILEVKTINRSDDDLHKHDPTFWVGRKGENGKPRRPGDIKCPLAFANNLRNKSDPVSAFLWEKLDTSDQKLLANCQPTPSEIEQMDSVLCRFLNKIIKGDCIYEKDRFQGVGLRPRTRDCMKDKPQGETLIFLNRWLLEDKYGDELLKKLPSSVWVFRPDTPLPSELTVKAKERIETARNQIMATLKRPSHQKELPVKERIVLLVIYPDAGPPVFLKQLQTELQQKYTDLVVICQHGDFD